MLVHCTAAAATLLLAAAGGAQTPPPAATPVVAGPSAFTIFIRGRDVGREQVTLARSGSDWLLTSTGQIGDFSTNRFELKYTADWQPVELRIEATQGGKEPKKLQLATSFALTTAINEITQDGVTNSKTDQISARTIVLPVNSFSSYEVLAARLAGTKPGAELPTYVPTAGEVRVTVKSIEYEDITTPNGIVRTRKYGLSVQNTGTPVPMTVVVDDKSRLARLEVPASALTVVRNDLAGVAVRPLTARNPTDADVRIPANGFGIAGTLTSPPGVGRLRHPTVVLVVGSGPVDRDSTVAGIPIHSQLAGALAQQGFLVLRYDKRGIGQTGGRSEAATLRDYADDLIGVVRWLARRDDVDERRITVIGHGEGTAVAMLAAEREKKISSLVLMAALGTTGAELILEQQRHELARLKLSDAERAQKVALQQQLQAAVVTDTGWDALPPEIRQQADTAWFRSFLSFDAAKVMPRLKQPVLILQGDLDTQVRPHHADKLAELARGRKRDAGAAEVVHFPGVNHLMVPATTGEVEEYPELKAREISPEVSTTIVSWLKKT